MYTAVDLAERLSLTAETVREMARTGRIPARKVGRVWRFDQDDIEHWLAAKRNTSSQASGPTRVAERVLPLYETQESGANAASFNDPAFSENRSQAVHRWVPWIAGFSGAFVSDCLNTYLSVGSSRKYLVLDPFAGVGTTMIEARKHGHDSIGFEINPYAVLACKAKMDAFTLNVTVLRAWTNAFNIFMETASSTRPPQTIAPPAGFRSRIPFFSPQVEPQVLWALQFIDGVGDPIMRRLFLTAFGSVMVSFSNYSYEPSLATRPAAGKPLVETADVTSVIVAKLRHMAMDCEYIQRTVRPPAAPARETIVEDSFFNAREHLEESSVDLAITSPPYLNNYHYVRNTRPHLFWLNFVEKSADLKRLEHSNFGKFWQTVRAGQTIDLDFSLPELEELLQAIRQRNREKGIYGGAGWANYATQYFNDMWKFCAMSHVLLKGGGRLVVVIGNSILQGVEIRVDEFLARIGEMTGLIVEATHMLRTKRVGNSIIRSSVRNKAKAKASLYEVAVVLRKP